MGGSSHGCEEKTYGSQKENSHEEGSYSQNQKESSTSQGAEAQENSFRAGHRTQESERGSSERAKCSGSGRSQWIARPHVPRRVRRFFSINSTYKRGP